MSLLAISFGGPDDGNTYDSTADPPFGYRAKKIFHHGVKRRIFIHRQMDDTHIDLEILNQAISRADRGYEPEGCDYEQQEEG